MSLANALLLDAFGRVKEAVHGAVEGLDSRALTYRVDPDANTIAWLVWHLTRIQDDHLAHLAGTEQVWQRDDWVGRFGLPFGREAHGYGMSSKEVAAVDVPAELLLGYHDAVHAQTVAYVAGLEESEYDEVIDRSWDPPVTRAVRLVSVVEDDMQHVGQAAFVRGVQRIIYTTGAVEHATSWRFGPWYKFVQAVALHPQIPTGLYLEAGKLNDPAVGR